MIQNIPLGELFSISSGGTPSRKEPPYYEDGNIAWIKTGDLHVKRIFEASEYITREGLDNSSAKLFPAGTVLVAMYGATIGACSILEIEAATNQACAAFLPNSEVDTLYLYYFLKSKKNDFVRDGVGGAQPNISATYLKMVEIPLPPLETQKHIAAVLEKADQLRKDCQQMEQELNSLAQSVFIDMFGDPVTNPKGWKLASLEHYILTGPTNGLYKHADSYGSGTPIIRIDGFYNGKLNNINTFKRVEITEIELSRYRVDNRGVLINRVNSPQYLGKAAFVDGVIENTVYESNMMYLTVDESCLNARYLVSLLASPLVKSQIKNCSKDAVNQSSINQKDVKSFKILIPDIDLQNKYEKVLLKLDCQLQSLHQYSVETEIQFNALIQKAFNGELNLDNAKTQ